MTDDQILQIVKKCFTEEWCEEDGHGWTEFSGKPDAFVKFAQEIRKQTIDEVLKESAEEIQRQYNKHLMTVLYGSSFADGVSYEENGDKYIVIPSENYEYLMEPQDNSFFGKIKRGWKLFYYSLEEWYDVMYYDEFEEEFFDYLGRSIEDL